VATAPLESRVMTQLERDTAGVTDRIDRLETTVNENHVMVKDHIAVVVHGSIDRLSRANGSVRIFVGGAVTDLTSFRSTARRRTSRAC
jgi:hypothetical protein